MNFYEVQAPQGNPRASTEKLCFTVPETCFSTGLSRSTIYILLQQKKLRSIKIGSKTLIPADSLRSFLNSLESEAS